MGITEEILKKKRDQKENKAKNATEDNSSITQMLLQRRKAGLRAMPSPAESVGAGTALFGPLAEARENQAKNLLAESVNIFLENKRQNAPSPMQAVQQLGLNVSPVTTMELPTATEPDYVAQALGDNGRLEEIQQEIQAAKQTQWDNPLPKGVASGLKFAQTMRDNPEEGLKQVRANLEAQDKVRALTRERDRIQYIRSNAGKTYEDNFIGQFGASYALGRMRQDESLAWNKYLDQPTEENRAYAQAISQLIAQFETENADTLDDDATLPWISQSLANYLPQFWDQVQYGAVGAIGGAAAGSAVPVLGTAAGIKAGITAASGLYSYQTMRGAAFKTLLDLGASEEVAREAAGDEAVVSSLIEMADTGIDLLTLGGGKLISALTKGGVKNLAKEGAEKAAESAGKKLLKALGKYGLNVAGEFTEEATQQAVSIANANRVEAGVDNGILGLMADAGYGVLWEAAENADDPNRAEILKAGFQGAIVAGLMGPLQAGINQAAYVGTNMLAFTGNTQQDNIDSEQYGRHLRQNGFDGVVIDAGLKFKEGSTVNQMAEALKQKQEAGQEITDVELGDLYRSIKLGAQQELQNTVQTARSEAARQQSTESGILLPTADDLEVIGTTESRVRETGMLAGAREADIESAERISQAMGRNVEFFREEAGQAGTVNGFYDANTGTIYINSQSQNPVAQIIAHELTHSVELAESYQELKTVALEQLERDGVNLEERRKQVRELYQRNGKVLAGNEEIDSELVAQFVETKLLTDEATIMELTRTNRPLMERVLNWINRTLQQLGLKKTTERDTLERAREIYARALRETQVQQEAAVADVQETGTREVAGNSEQLAQRETLDQEQLERKELEQEYRNVIQVIRKSLESGNITEEEFDATFDAILEDASRDGVDLLNDQVKYSVSETTDSQGRELSPEQVEFFRDSKVRDEDGRLKVMYHGTPYGGFTVFREGTYFTDNPQYAEVYHIPSASSIRGRYDQVTLPMTYAVYLNIKKPFDTRNEDAREIFYREYYRQYGMGTDLQESGLPDWLDAEDLREFLEENEYDYDGLIVDEGGTGGYDEEVRKRGLAYIAFRPDQIKQVANRNPSENPDIRYSVSDDQQKETDNTITLPTADSESQLLRDQLPVKAKKYLQQAERSMMNTIGQSLSIPYRARRDILTGTVQQMSEEYLQTGRISEETRKSLFGEAYEAGIVQDREFLDQYKGLRDYLRDTTLQISKKDSADIPDFNDYRRRNFGRLNISTSGGTNIDQVYKELAETWPEFFNEYRESTPSDQLNRISEVVKNFQVTERSLDEYYGPEAETFKKFAYHDFSAAIDEQLQELQAVRRYQEQSQRQQQRVEEQKPKTIQEVVQLWDQFKQEKKRYEKVAAKNLLTEEDERLVGQLLRGEITELALDPETNNVKGILAVYESKREFDRIAKQLREWNADRRNALKKLADQYLTTANGWKDKRSGILYSRETMERNIRDIVPDEALAKSIIDEYFTPVHKGTAAATKMKNDFRQRVKDMNLSRDIAKGNIVSEAHAVQLLGEAEDNIRYMEKAKWTRERDGKTIDEWRQVVADLWKENPNLDQKKIQDAVNKFRLMYDELFQKMNEVRVRNGYEPINYRSGYFPHFQPGDGDGIIAAFGRALGISTEVTALPTSINGLTHTFKPGIQWFGNAQERLGFNTAYDAVEGFDKYIEGVADVVHHTDNIQKLRQLANQVRYRTTSEGIRKQVDAVLANDSLAEIDKQNRIEDIYKNGRFSMSNFVVELEEYTNLLANKKSLHDRTVEKDLNRKIYNLAKWLEGRVGANMVAINPASWLTNLIPLTQGWAGVRNTDILRGMWDTLRGMNKQDGIIDRSTFLTNRRGSDPLVKAWEQGAIPEKTLKKAWRQANKIAGETGDMLSSPMEIIDNITSESLIRARYAQNIRKGLSEQNAMDEADAWVAGVMADRSKGSMPTLFMRKNPFTKLVTQFQQEANNQLSYLFKDIPRETKQAGVKVLTWALVKFAVGAWLYDELYERLIGRRPALDPFGILDDTVQDLTGWEIPELVIGALRGELPEPEEKTSLYDAAANLGEEVLEQVPFTGALNWIGADLDAGRLPISNAIPDIGNIVKALTDSELAGNKRADLFLRELADTAGAYLVLPYGGGQLKKILQTAEAVVRGGRYSVNNEGELQLQYPVFNDEATDIAGNAIWGSVFGPTTLPTGREWVENGFGSLSVDQTIAYEAMKEAGAEDETAFQVIQDYRAAEDNEARRKVIRNADINGDAKAALYYQLMASDTERQQLDLLDDAGQDMGEIIDTLLDIKDMDAEARVDSETDEEKPLFDEKQIEAITAAGLKENDAALAAVERENIWANRDLTTDEKKAEFSRWLNEQDYSADEQHALYNAIIEGGESESEAGQENRYARMVSSGIDDDIAYAITSDISRLEKLEGAESVSREQKRSVVFDRLADPEQQLKALETVNLESQQKKFVLAYENGVMPEVYAAVIAELPNYDEDGNGSLNQEEVTNALNSMGRGALTLPGGANDFTLSRQDKAVIWQLYNKSWKSKNNPFGASVGNRVYNALNTDKED